MTFLNRSLSAGLAGFLSIPLAAAAGNDASLLRGAWIAAELGSPDSAQPRAEVEAKNPGPIATAAVTAPAPASRSAPAAATAEPMRGAEDGRMTLRERLSARSYKNETAGVRSATAGAVRHTAAFAAAMQSIEAMKKAKAANPSRAIGDYLGPGTSLQNAAVLPPKGYGWFYMADATNFGTDPMVFGLMEVFALMADAYPDGTEIRVGDIGLQQGGPIDGHLSHRTGRDVDLAIFGTMANGKPVNRMIAYDAQGMGDGGSVRYDAVRNFDFAVTMMESHTFEVLLILVDQPLKDILLRSARERAGKARSDAEAQLFDRRIQQAERVLVDGGHEHNNHFHLRIR